MTLRPQAACMAHLCLTRDGVTDGATERRRRNLKLIQLRTTILLLLLLHWIAE
jgi:hypothetical protein